MNCTIDAWLEKDTAHLRILDADSGRVHLDWTWSGGSDTAESDARAALHRLVSGLFLVSCIGNLRDPAGDTPVPCGQPPGASARPEARILKFPRVAGQS
ncbi:MAG: hypothetical protein RBT81_10155 [Gammaproteobacteria bacterium]|jgi:hypothetical protein|nr:hypothetical protein [Gammaproteobacteria bacterium]